MSKSPKRPNRSNTVVKGKPRRRVGSVWRSRGMTVVLSVVLLGLLGGGAWWSWKNGAVGQAVDGIKWRLIAASVEIGFRVDDVLVVSRKETARDDLLNAVRLVRGAPILAFDLDAARRRVEALPWIRRATVERMLPDTILVSVEERRPLALWQHRGRFALIDFDGDVIMRSGLDRFGDLLVVVGEGAPEHTAELLSTLGTEPELMKLVKAAVWVGGRRWNIRLEGDIDVRLPEENPASAWERLADYERRHRVLERDVQILDLRIPDRLIVRKAPGNAKETERKKPGQET